MDGTFGLNAEIEVKTLEQIKTHFRGTNMLLKRLNVGNRFVNFSIKDDD